MLALFGSPAAHVGPKTLCPWIAPGLLFSENNSIYLNKYARIMPNLMKLDSYVGIKP
jgi:hypothetical protein